MLGYFSGDLVWYPVRHVGLRLPTSTEDHSPGHLLVPDEHQRGEPPGPRPPHIKADGLQVCCSLDILLTMYIEGSENFMKYCKLIIKK